MPYADIASITFSRVGGGASASSARTFDMLVTMKGGLEYAYSGIPREEYAGLDEFLRLKKLRVKNEMADEVGLIVDICLSHAC